MAAQQVSALSAHAADRITARMAVLMARLDADGFLLTEDVILRIFESAVLEDRALASGEPDE